MTGAGKLVPAKFAAGITHKDRGHAQPGGRQGVHSSRRPLPILTTLTCGSFELGRDAEPKWETEET
jgi:hypothetical protein